MGAQDYRIIGEPNLQLSTFNLQSSSYLKHQGATLGRIMGLQDYRIIGEPNLQLSTFNLQLSTIPFSYNRRGLLSILILFSFVLHAVIALGQGTVRDTSLFDPHVTMSYAYQVPGGDLAGRFGNNSNLALGFHIKSRSQWYYGIQGQFIFGNQVIKEEGFLQNLMVDGSYVLDNDGYPATLVLMQRGFAISADAGRLFPVVGPNKNSGILVKAGAGFLQHKIRIEHQETHIAQLEGDYLKGYDRMANGPAVTGFVGYYHMSNNRLINFVLGVEGWRAFSEPRRAMNFDTQESEQGTRKDVLLGLRVGWTLHLYKRMSDNFFYY